jgi:hypothetical protein
MSSTKKPKKPSKAEIKAAIKLLAGVDPISSCMEIMDAAKCARYLFAGRTAAGSVFAVRGRGGTDRRVRGLIRECIKQDCEEQRPQPDPRDDDACGDAWSQRTNDGAHY